MTIRSRIAGVVCIVSSPLLAATTSVVSVTSLPNSQVRVCWQSAPEATMYWIEGSDGIEDTVVRDSGAGTLCRDVNVFGVAACQASEVTVRVATLQKGQDVFGEQSPHFHFIFSGVYGIDRVGDDFFAAPGIRSPADRYPTIDAAVSRAPAQLALTDLTTSSDAAPRVRLNLQCVTQKANLVRYEIYENTLKPDGSITTRTTKSEACPNDLVLSGRWGDRSTITVAAIFRDLDEPNKFNHSICTSPRTITYGSALVPAPVLSFGASGAGPLLGGGVKGDVDDVLLLVNPTDAYQLMKPTRIVAGKKFEVAVDLNRGFNRFYAISRRTASGRTFYSEPVELLAQWKPEPRSALTLNDLPAYAMFDHIYVTGTGPAETPAKVTLSRDNKQVAETTLHSCVTGEFASNFFLGKRPAGEYKLILATLAGCESQTVSTTLHLNEIYPAPAVSVYQGRGPFRTKEDRAEIKGRLTPYLDSTVNIAARGHPVLTLSGYELQALLNGKPVEAKVDEAEFTVTASPLQPGTNALLLTAVFPPTSQRSEPLQIEIIRGNQRARTDSAVELIDLELAAALRKEADQQFENEKWKDALAAYTKVLEVNPRSPAAYADRAAVNIRLGDVKAAFDDATRALQLDERDYQAHALRTNYLFSQRKYAEAMPDLNRAIELDSKFGMSYDNRGMARFQLGQYSAAIADASKAIELTPQYSYSYTVRAMAYDQLGRPGDALADLAKAIAADPESHSLVSTRAQVYEHMGDYDKSITDYTALISADAENAATNYNARAWAEYQKGDIDAAVADATKSIALSPTPYAYGTRAWARRAKGDSSGALDDLAKAARLDADYHGMDTDRGLAEYIRGNYSRAVELWQKRLEQSGSERNAIAPLLEDARAKVNRSKK